MPYLKMFHNEYEIFLTTAYSQCRNKQYLPFDRIGKTFSKGSVQLVCCALSWNCRTRKDVFSQKMLLLKVKIAKRPLQDYYKISTVDNSTAHCQLY